MFSRDHGLVWVERGCWRSPSPTSCSKQGKLHS